MMGDLSRPQSEGASKRERKTGRGEPGNTERESCFTVQREEEEAEEREEEREKNKDLGRKRE